MKNSLIRAKAETLCWGIKFDELALKKALEVYPPLLDEVHIHAAHVFLDNRIPVNAVLVEKFVDYSPYQMKWENGEFKLYKNAKYLFNCSLRPAPRWYFMETSTGRPMHEILALHGARTLALAEYVRCDYINAGQACQFCSVPIINIQEKIRLKEIQESFEAALSYNESYSVALSEGARFTSDRGARYHVEMINAIREVKNDTEISVELVPPEHDEYLVELVESGASALIMNMEFLSEQIRKKYMPAKSKVSVERYYSAWEKGVALLGAGHVSSVLILGVEDKKYTLEAASEATSRGVIPTIMPFRPYDHTPMKSHGLTSPDDYYEVSQEIAEMLAMAGLNPFLQKGCVECGACSLEIDFAMEKQLAQTDKGWISVDMIG